MLSQPGNCHDDDSNSDLESDLSCVPQLDGQLASPFSPITSQQPPITVSLVRNAPYTLNKEKQLTRLGQNASIANFTIDQTGPTNINIQCSTGFYQLVAKPTLSGLLAPNLTVKGVPVFCSDEVTPKLDQMRRNVNAVLHFKVGNKEQQESATVHLHHTQQKVQVQGRAAPWFVENVLKNIFEEEAKNNELNIRHVNHQASTVAAGRHVDSSSSASSRLCFHCKKMIRTNAKLVSVCGNCCNSFHNSKTSPCFTSHACGGTVPPRSSSSNIFGEISMNKNLYYSECFRKFE